MECSNNGLNRVVVTGMGAIAPNGIGVESFWTALKHGKSAISNITRFDASSYDSQIAGEIKDFDPSKHIPTKEIGMIGRFSQFALVASKFALQDSGLRPRKQDTSRIGVIIGTTVGGFDVAEQQHSIFIKGGLRMVDPIMGANVLPNAASGFIAVYYKITGPNITVATACSAGLNAIGYAFDLIRYKRIDIAIAGGAEAPIVPLTFGSFDITHSLSTRNNDPGSACRPFAKGRDGFVVSEGAGIVVLESLDHAVKRGANIYGEVLGYASSNDAHHIANADPSGESAALAIKGALQDARLNPEEVDYVCAHGSAYPSYDIKETRALKIALGDHAYKTPISSIKSMIGHPFSAGGALQFIASIQVCRENIIPPTINYDEPDPNCDLDYVPNKAREKEVNFIICNAFGYGGSNASLVLTNGKKI